MNRAAKQDRPSWHFCLVRLELTWRFFTYINLAPVPAGISGALLSRVVSPRHSVESQGKERMFVAQPCSIHKVVCLRRRKRGYHPPHCWVRGRHGPRNSHRETRSSGVGSGLSRSPETANLMLSWEDTCFANAEFGRRARQPATRILVQTTQLSETVVCMGHECGATGVPLLVKNLQRGGDTMH